MRLCRENLENLMHLQNLQEEMYMETNARIESPDTEFCDKIAQLMTDLTENKPVQTRLSRSLDPGTSHVM